MAIPSVVLDHTEANTPIIPQNPTTKNTKSHFKQLYIYITENVHHEAAAILWYFMACPSVNSISLDCASTRTGTLGEKRCGRRCSTPISFLQGLILGNLSLPLASSLSKSLLMLNICRIMRGNDREKKKGVLDQCARVVLDFFLLETTALQETGGCCWMLLQTEEVRPMLPCRRGAHIGHKFGLTQGIIFWGSLGA